ncbi:MAG: glycoside hydrolase family 2 TIM barrel-domain containing protein [Candidatus Omnitrophica bacterium]|nr:glycoside hydrolase family 2 TIM barrel-domain containing protein [Candidatus Omnitrophota bacterium]MDD5653307.1 glycoside hydrolase family 2 TIM barrel-domain containing protein [Candidatus Omnitrophota bacterium]
MAKAPQSAQVFVKKLSNGGYQLIVERRPYIIKGVCYNPIPVGENHEYDWWSDPNKPWIADGKLMKAMGVNTIRLYQSHDNPEEVRAVIRDLYQLYGIRTVMGDWLGYWEYPCPFYGNKDFQEKVKKEVLNMVEEYKNEPGMLFWVLGNENNYSCLGTVRPWSSEEVDQEKDPLKQKALKAKIYYSFVNELAQEIKNIDPNHPVAMGNGELVGLGYAKEYAPNIDIIACIIYRGKTFGNLFKSLKATFDKPVFIAEFGADAYDANLQKEDQNMQAFFLESQWRQIYENLANGKDGEGNCLGGTVFEWSDEWWKHEEGSSDGWKTHDTLAGWLNASYYFDIKAKDNMNMNEEWFGLVALSPEIADGLNKRIPRKAYYVVRDFWKKPDLNHKKRKR